MSTSWVQSVSNIIGETPERERTREKEQIMERKQRNAVNVHTFPTIVAFQTGDNDIYSLLWTLNFQVRLSDNLYPHLSFYGRDIYRFISIIFKQIVPVSRK